MFYLSGFCLSVGLSRSYSFMLSNLLQGMCSVNTLKKFMFYL